MPQAFDSFSGGAHVDLAPLFDDRPLGADPNRSNGFTHAQQGEDLQSDQTRCPFSAPIRKTASRLDFNLVNTQNRIIRLAYPTPECETLYAYMHIRAAQSPTYLMQVTAQGAQWNAINVERDLAFSAYFVTYISIHKPSVSTNASL